MKMLRTVRKNCGLTMKELGEKVGVSESAISQYETGKRQPDNETLLKLGETLGVTVGYLLGAEDKERTPSVQDYDGLDEYLEVLKNRAECRMLFSVAKDASKEDVEKAVAIIEALRRTEGC